MTNMEIIQYTNVLFTQAPIRVCPHGTNIDSRFSCALNMMIKVTILSAQPLIPSKRLYAQKVQACFDMY